MKIFTVLKTPSLWAASFAVAVLTSSFEFAPVEGAVRDASIHKVVIDAGHGGKDPGCSGRSTVEKDIALSISLELGRLISAKYPEIEVIYTRKTDVFIPLDERAHIANRADADLFISIHCNTISRRNQAQGSETYVMGLHRAPDNLAVAKRENASILMEDNYIEKYDGYDPDSPEGHIILSMYQNAYLEQSILLADCIERQFVNGLARKSRGVKQAGFLVLRTTTMPSVLVEAGFLSHDNDEGYLAEKENRNHMANAIFKAFMEYKATLEGLIPEDGGPVLADAAPVKSTPPPAVVVAETGGGMAPKPAAPKENKVPERKPVVLFYVQLAASRTSLSSTVSGWKVGANLETRQEDGYYKYLAGPFTEVEEANVVLKDVRGREWKDAFVVAYRDAQRISVKEAVAAQ